MPNVLQVFPEAEGEEQLLISGLIADMTDQQAQTFAVAYRAQRKDPTTCLILTIIGFIILAGIGRFYVGNIGMGILYLLTGGLCYVGTIIDVFRHKRITFQANLVKAQQIAAMAKAQSNT
ncbi:MAG: TM2 domain-containing protein [Chloroflexi bacterium]|nr:TM2 domain-containing protein [Chloroflexota bacterium]